MTKQKQETNYTPEQMEQLSGSYKNSDNTMDIERNETKQVNERDGVSSKRPQ